MLAGDAGCLCVPLPGPRTPATVRSTITTITQAVARSPACERLQPRSPPRACYRMRYRVQPTRRVSPASKS